MGCVRGIAGALVLMLAALSAAGQQWVEVRSPNFSVVTDGGEKRGREVALRFEQLRAIFGALLGRERINFPVPLQIVAFRNNTEFRQYAPLWQGRATKLAGYFQPGEDRNFITLDLSETEESWTTVFHEYAHLLLSANVPGTELWFEEGFAEYYSTVKISGDEVEIGGASPGRVEQLRGSRWLSLPELFSVRRDSQIYNEAGDRRSLFYAQSWLMVHFLLDTKKLKETAVYFSLAEQGVPVPDAIQKAFNMTPKKLQEAVEDYFRVARALLYRLKLPEEVKRIQFTTKPLDEADSQAVLADLHLHEKDYHDQAMKEFQAVLRLKPDHALANRGLGYAYLRDNDFEKAAEHFRRAAAANSQDPRVHYYVAMLMSREAAMAGRSPQDLPAMRKELETAIALNPDYADAWNLLALVDTLEDTPDKAIEHMRRAVELSPSNEMYAANLALYLMNAHQWDEAEPILKRLQSSENAQIAAGARLNLEQLARVRQPRVPLEQARREPAAPPPAETGAREEVPKVEEPKPEEPRPEEPKPDVRPIKYLRGTLTAVDCSKPPAATLTIVSAGKTWIMRAANMDKLLLIGADRFSCQWKNRKVLVNYRAGGPTQADLVSLEVQ